MAVLALIPSPYTGSTQACTTGTTQTIPFTQQTTTTQTFTAGATPTTITTVSQEQGSLTTTLSKTVTYVVETTTSTISSPTTQTITESQTTYSTTATTTTTSGTTTFTTTTPTTSYAISSSATTTSTSLTTEYTPVHTTRTFIATLYTATTTSTTTITETTATTTTSGTTSFTTTTPTSTSSVTLLTQTLTNQFTQTITSNAVCITNSPSQWSASSSNDHPFASVTPNTIDVEGTTSGVFSSDGCTINVGGVYYSYCDDTFDAGTPVGFQACASYSNSTVVWGATPDCYGLQLYYSFGEAPIYGYTNACTTRVMDLSNNGIAGTCENSPDWVKGEFRGGMEFTNTSSSYVAYSPTTALNTTSFTQILYLNVSTTTNSGMYVWDTRSSSGDYGDFWEVSKSSLVVGFASPSGSDCTMSTSSGFLSVGNTIGLALTYSGGNMSLYDWSPNPSNPNAVVVSLYSSKSCMYYPHGETSYLGAEYSLSNYASARITEVRQYSYAMPVSVIQQYAQSTPQSLIFQSNGYTSSHTVVYTEQVKLYPMVSPATSWNPDPTGKIPVYGSYFGVKENLTSFNVAALTGSANSTIWADWQSPFDCENSYDNPSFGEWVSNMSVTPTYSTPGRIFTCQYSPAYYDTTTTSDPAAHASGGPASEKEAYEVGLGAVLSAAATVACLSAYSKRRKPS